MLPNIQVAELLKRELAIGDTLFRFAELSAWEAYPMLERIRHEIANTEASIRADQLGTDGTAEAAALFKMVVGARPQFVREQRAPGHESGQARREEEDPWRSLTN